jgi:hypothetical protein
MQKRESSIMNAIKFAMFIVADDIFVNKTSSKMPQMANLMDVLNFLTVSSNHYQSHNCCHHNI